MQDTSLIVQPSQINSTFEILNNYILSGLSRNTLIGRARPSTIEFNAVRDETVAIVTTTYEHFIVDRDNYKCLLTNLPE